MIGINKGGMLFPLLFLSSQKACLLLQTRTCAALGDNGTHDCDLKKGRAGHEALTSSAPKNANAFQCYPASLSNFWQC